MTNLFERALRRSRLLLLSAVIAALAACGGGVGTGGTGTGPIQGTVSFGAAGGAPVGSQCVNCTLDLQLQELRVDLAMGCLRFAHTGGWDIGAGGEAVLAGTLQTGSASGPATLRLQFSEGVVTSTQVTAVLADERGAVVLGPVVLRRTDGVVALPSPDCTAL